MDESVVDDESLIDLGDSSLSYFGADFDLSGLVRRLGEGDIVIPRFDPDESEGLSVESFQRQRVWSFPRMEKFVESLLLGWPVPSIFLVVEPDQRYLVLDGQQRLTTLQYFYSGSLPDGKPFALQDVAKHLVGATYSTLNSEGRRRLNNTFIQAIVIEPQGDPGRDSVYQLFGRLNSGGVILTPQEIRVALYRGPLINWIRDLNHDPSWRVLFGAVHMKLKDHELILRALAMREVLVQMSGKWSDGVSERDSYKPPMATFLNGYLKAHRDMKGVEKTEIGHAFAAACELLVKTFGADGLKFAGRLNAAHVDATLGALMFLHGDGSFPAQAALREGIAKLRADGQYANWVSCSTSHRESVIGRLRRALDALSSKSLTEIQGRKEAHALWTGLQSEYKRYNQAVSFIPPDHLRLQEDLRRYLCLRCAGFLEQLTFLAVNDFLSKKSSPPVLHFARSFFKRSPNLTAHAFVGLIARFGPPYDADFDEFLTAARRDTLSDLLQVRNDIAHGNYQAGRRLNPDRYIGLCRDIYDWMLKEFLDPVVVID